MPERKTSNKIHIVISTRELQDPTTLVDWFINNKYTNRYVVSVETGTSGHPHIDCFCEMKKEYRMDKVKDSIMKLYGITDYIERKNVRAVINYIDEDPMYGYGYTLKEDPKEFYTNILDQEYLTKCKEYYLEHEAQVNNMKQEVISKNKLKRQITLDTICNDFLEYCVLNGVETVYRYDIRSNTKEPINKFTEFFHSYSIFIPYSLFAKINYDKLYEWTECHLERARLLDCAPNQKPL